MLYQRSGIVNIARLKTCQVIIELLRCFWTHCSVWECMPHTALQVSRCLAAPASRTPHALAQGYIFPSSSLPKLGKACCPSIRNMSSWQAEAVLVSGIWKACWMLSHRASLGGARQPSGCSTISSCSETKLWELKYMHKEEEHLEGRERERGVKNPPWQALHLVCGECKHASGCVSSRLGTWQGACCGGWQWHQWRAHTIAGYLQMC